MTPYGLYNMGAPNPNPSSAGLLVTAGTRLVRRRVSWQPSLVSSSAWELWTMRPAVSASTRRSPHKRGEGHGHGRDEDSRGKEEHRRAIEPQLAPRDPGVRHDLLGEIKGKLAHHALVRDHLRVVAGRGPDQGPGLIPGQVPEIDEVVFDTWQCPFLDQVSLQVGRGEQGGHREQETDHERQRTQCQTYASEGRNGRTGHEKGDDQNQEGGNESHESDVLTLGELEPVDDAIQEVGEPGFGVTRCVGRHPRLRATPFGQV